jgi:predicted transcriptional regulator
LPEDYINALARIAVYDDMAAAPRIVDINPAPTLEFINEIAVKTYDLAHAQGGDVPYSTIREIAENFIHASFQECTISVLDHGKTLRFSDQGPGIENKNAVLQPGFTSATKEMKKYIRGVGSGFPLVQEYLENRDGHLTIEDNVVDGTVVTLTVISNNQKKEKPLKNDKLITGEFTPISSPILTISLKPREMQALYLIKENGMLGTTDLTSPLNISAPTATRILKHLDGLGLIEQTNNRKRILSNLGVKYLHEHMSDSEKQ